MAKLIVVLYIWNSTTAYSGEARGAGATERRSTIFRLRKIIAVVRCSTILRLRKIIAVVRCSTTTTSIVRIA
jgi:hypothetical protein